MTTDAAQDTTGPAGGLTENERRRLLAAWPWPASTAKEFAYVATAVEQIIRERAAPPASDPADGTADLRMELRMAIAHASAALAALDDEHEGDTTSCVHALYTCANVARIVVTNW